LLKGRSLRWIGTCTQGKVEVSRAALLKGRSLRWIGTCKDLTSLKAQNENRIKFLVNDFEQQQRFGKIEVES
jgi:hypothetical protein